MTIEASRKGCGPIDVNPTVQRPNGYVPDTIAAVSTAAGAGAIGIVRMSGPEAQDIGHRIFRPAVERPAAATRTEGAGGRRQDSRSGDRSTKASGHRLRYGHVVDPRTEDVVDEVLFAVMEAPSTYTREDVVEIHCHGGPAAQRAVLALLLREGARAAEPGEFTHRAFLNGRIDLTQAESVATVVRARTDAALKAGVRQLQGRLGDRLRELRKELVSVLADIEVTIDFSDEDVDDVDRGALADRIDGVASGLEQLLSTAFLGRALNEGVRTAIVGLPNVGKSSLLNALLMQERAIVSEIPGTTRDTVEGAAEIGGLPLRLIDTAGLRDDSDQIEALGIERTRAAIEDADLVLAVLDGERGVGREDDELLAVLPPGATLLVLNKIDLVDHPRRKVLVDAAEESWHLRHATGDGPVLVSAVTGEGLDELRDRVRDFLLGAGAPALEEPMLATERQTRLVDESLQEARAAGRALEDGQPDEVVAEGVRRAADLIGRITGEEVVPDLVEEIFSRFCIGK